MDKQVMEPETVKGVQVFAAGDHCAAALKGGRIYWCARFDEVNAFARDISLPHGVNPGDVGALTANAGGVTVVTKRGDFYTYGVELEGGRWSPPANLFRPPAGAR